MHDSNVKHHGREEAVGEGPRLPVVQLPFGRFIELQLRLSVCFGAERRRQVGGRDHREMGDEGILIRIVDLDGDQPGVLDPLEGARAPADRPGRGAHIGDLDDTAAAVAGCRDGIAAGDGQRQRRYSRSTCSPASSAATASSGWSRSGAAITTASSLAHSISPRVA